MPPTFIVNESVRYPSRCDVISSQTLTLFSIDYNNLSNMSYGGYARNVGPGDRYWTLRDQITHVSATRNSYAVKQCVINENVPLSEYL